MSFKLFKLPLLLLSAISYHVALTDPTSSDTHDKVMVTSLRERIWAHAAIPTTIFIKSVTWSASLAESVVIVGSVWGVPSKSTAIKSVLKVLGPQEASQLTAPFVVGAGLMIVGGIIRVECFRALGPFFTVRQVLRKDHQLVTTGPYAVVRHPGYTSLLMCIFGSFVVYSSPSSWLRASGLLDVPSVRAVFTGLGVVMTAAVITLFRRSTEEDQFLADRFGKEWESWAVRVRYRLVPFIY